MLSDHFATRELFPIGPPPDKLELYLARTLCQNVLEPLRKIAQAPLSVTDGRRTMDMHEEYEALGYHPSPTSDHSYGAGFLIAGGKEDGLVATARGFPGSWFFGTGAADVKPLRNGQRRSWTVAEFEEAERNLITGRRSTFPQYEPDGPVIIGQLIYYPVRGHLHVSNPWGVLFSGQAIGGLALPAKRGPAYVYPEQP